jgi:very-short-patch-repair endonuclease
MTGEQRRFARTLRQQATSAEDCLWTVLRGRRFHGLKFKRQVPCLLYTVDFMCLDRKLIVELDGRQHEWHRDYDAKRTEEIERLRFHLLRFTNDEILSDLDTVLHRIKDAAFPAGDAPQQAPSAAYDLHDMQPPQRRNRRPETTLC